jgi:hypothetical protein
MEKNMHRLKRISIITGNLGSGKTEIAINLALHLAGQGLKTFLVDLDIINPYFRTRLVRGKLEEKGLQVISPLGDKAFADVPALSPAVKGVIENRAHTGVFDVGGDDVGAVALGRYRDMLKPEDFMMIFVVNTCRPFTGSREGIIKYLDSIERASGLPVRGLVCNTNIGLETSPGVVLEGFQTVEAVAGEKGIPLLFTVVNRAILAGAQELLGGRSAVFPIDLYMAPPWRT